MIYNDNCWLRLKPYAWLTWRPNWSELAARLLTWRARIFDYRIGAGWRRKTTAWLAGVEARAARVDTPTGAIRFKPIAGCFYWTSVESARTMRARPAGARR